MGIKFSRRTEATGPATVAAGALRDRAPEDEQGRQVPPPAATTHSVGGRPDPEAQAAALVESSGGRLARAGGLLLQLQRAFGNRHVQQVVQHALRAVGPAPGSASALTLGPAEDRYEQQADQVARRLAGGAPSRQAVGDGAAAGRVSPAPAMQDERGGVDGRVRQAIQGARGGGQPLPQRVRDQVEPVVGTDLGRVRVHTDAQADELSRVLGARAFTTGGEVSLRRGEYRPDSPAGQRLLAHELAHVAQQAGGTVDADGGSGVSPGAAGAGVIQRITIRSKDVDYDTENQAQLIALKKTVARMSQDEARAMLLDIESKVTVDLPATPAVVSLQRLLKVSIV